MNDTTTAQVPLVAFHGDAAEKDAILAQLQLHYDADEIIHGVYWEHGKGCAVGCTIHSGNHAQYEPRFGIPQALARLEDRIFEGMGNGQSKEWPLRFMRAITPGADLSHVVWAFLHRVLTDATIMPRTKNARVEESVAAVASEMLALAKGNDVPLERRREIRAAASAASAVSAAAAASAGADASAAAAYAASADASAAAAAYASADAAASAASAAAYAAAAYAASADAYASADAATRGSYQRMADVLIELLEAAPMATVAA